MCTGPPKALGMPKPMSSTSTISTLGAPLGAFTSNRAGGFTSRASSAVITAGLGSGIGSIVRSMPSARAESAPVAVDFDDDGNDEQPFNTARQTAMAVNLG